MGCAGQSCVQSVGSTAAVVSSELRPDVVGEGGHEEALLSNARTREGQYFAVPKFAGSST
jgi:Asp-tRNA(Asn)/Glu-tRNA(Gln) amidotransferase C subunit